MSFYSVAMSWISITLNLVDILTLLAIYTGDDDEYIAGAVIL